jgi:glycosyltransferase involved in cell wall biosynthesis
VFLLTSRFEGLPRSVLQAMAAGVPVVATAVDGTPEVVLDGETGLLVPPADPEAAARAVLRVGTDAALADRLREAASRLLNAEFDLDRMVRDLEAEYLDLARRADVLSDGGARSD